MARPMRKADWTVDMLDALPDDGQRYEIIDGVLFVSPSPSVRHQEVVGLLLARLLAYFGDHRVGKAMTSPSDVKRGDPLRNRLQPDVYVVEYVDGRKPPQPYTLANLLLAVEVLSPSNKDTDYEDKRVTYLSSGVGEYWIVSPDDRMFLRLRHLDDPGELITERLEWWPSGMPAPFVLDLSEFFEEAFS